MWKSIIQGLSIKQPVSYRNEVNMSPEEWNEKKPQGYSIPGKVEEDSIPVNSTAISSAEYNPNDDSLNIAYTSNPSKSYKFKVNGEEGLKEWIEAPSKGRITQEWRETHRFPGY